ncbi:MAG: hypothetical protein R3320_09045 [Nitriliruptorales bacterium]|nr:hypothetical protein [Nitriliruptorales bacterium]
MHALNPTTWPAVLAIRQGGELWSVRSGDRGHPIAFPCGDAAGRFARILSRAEGTSYEPIALRGERLERWLDALSFVDAQVTIEPEYVHGDGVIGEQVPVGELRAALTELAAA